MPDARVQAAIDHWAPRFVGAGIDANDFNRTISQVERWDDWLDTWAALGDDHAGHAREAEDAGRTVTAGESWRQAAVAYHFARFVWVVDLARARPVHRRSIDASYAAYRLLGASVERLEVPLDGGMIVGNLRVPAGAAEPPLVLLIPGLDSTKEELFALEEVFLRRGMATCAVDGPGQGEGEPLPMRHDYEVAASAVLNALGGRGEVDLGRVGAMGVSMGGYFAPRAAAFEPRIRAVVAASGPFTTEPLWEAMTPISRDVFTYKTHAASPEEAHQAARRMSLDGVLQRLDRPALFVTGDQDRLVPWEQTQAQAKAAPRGEFVLFQGGGHVVSNYPHRFRSLAADWLHEQLV